MHIFFSLPTIFDYWLFLMMIIIMQCPGQQAESVQMERKSSVHCKG